MLSSVVCRYEHLLTDWYAKWSSIIGFPDVSSIREWPSNNFQRKHWEWCAISQALSERDMLSSGRKGIGFAVGREALPALFTSYGVDILATDQAIEKVGPSWQETGQHADNREVLFYKNVCSRKMFDKHVQF